MTPQSMFFPLYKISFGIFCFSDKSRLFQEQSNLNSMRSKSKCDRRTEHLQSRVFSKSSMRGYISRGMSLRSIFLKEHSLEVEGERERAVNAWLGVSQTLRVLNHRPGRLEKVT